MKLSIGSVIVNTKVSVIVLVSPYVSQLLDHLASCRFYFESVKVVLAGYMVDFVGTVLSQQPLRLRVEVLSSSSVRVSWDEIESGDHDAETFTIEYRKAGESGWQEITGILLTYATVDGLIPNKEYDFRVFGVNGAGSGPKTDIMTTTTSEDGELGLADPSICENGSHLGV